SSGSVRVFGHETRADSDLVRQSMGVVFQSFSLDKLLTVEENLKCQGRLYGLSGSDLQNRIEDRLTKVGLRDRLKDRVGTLSGGMQRRVEIAKGLLHQPRLLLMDEPSTGLDPGARIDLWRYLKKLQQEEGTTIFLTTHLMEEAEKCDRLGILSKGKLSGLGSPRELKSEIGGEVVTLSVKDRESASKKIAETFGAEVNIQNGSLRFEIPHAKDRINDILNLLSEEPESIHIGKATLEDVFIHRTGHRFWEEEDSES
ncbi:MAG: ATP-binding cassette domain-containing protein, partial [Candidatus Omnitrophica bacterium]|nr:ATP-binding cassette domain-containing protein [Candidatus Omnitrophota bacterium]